MEFAEKIQPRRPAASEQDEGLDTFGEGEPIETALTADLSEVVACTEEAARISEGLKSPEMVSEERKRLARPQNQGQAERALLNASNLERAREIATQTGVEPKTLLELCDKRGILLRGRRGGLLVQGDAADGKLLLGSLFRFLAGKVDGAVAARLARLAPDSQERRDLLADTAEINAQKEAIASKGLDTREENADAVARLATDLQTARDEVDFLSMQRQIAEGQAPDAALLPSASRHAEREKEAARAAAATSKAAERRDKRRR